MSALRHQVWVSKMGNNKLNAAPELKVLPPTSAAFLELTKRAHLQVAIWKASLCKDPLKLNPTEYGWTFDKSRSLLLPTPVPVGTVAAPDDILKIIKCSCSSSKPCSSLHCSCVKSSLSCSSFCRCKGREICQNKQTILASAQDDLDLED